MAHEPRHFFLTSAVGQRFAVWHPASRRPALGAVLSVQAFAEEMNKSRRMVALQAARLAECGFDVLRIDLLGTGDSSGDHGEATWQAWLDDLVHAVDWLARESGAPLWLWGQRAGCLLACAVARQLARPVRFAFWQPPPHGKLVLQQFLRLKTMGDLSEGRGKGQMAALRETLAQGRSVEIAGYRLDPALAAGLEAALLEPPPGTPAAVFIEVLAPSPPGQPQAAPQVSPGVSASAARWAQSGVRTATRAVAGPPFWQTAEIEVVPELIRATAELMSESAS